MSLRIVCVFAAILFSVVEATADGEDLIGTWEMIDEEGDAFVWQFRADGVMIENDFYEDELVCVYVFPYEVIGDELTIGEGLNWEVDEETGELVLYEDFDDGEISVQYDVTDGELAILLDDLFLLNLVLFELLDESNLNTEELGIDLGVEDLEDMDLSDEQIEELFDVVYILALFGFLGDELDIFIPDVLDGVSDDADAEEVFEIVFLEAIAYELDIEEDVDVVELATDAEGALEIMQEVYFANTLIELLEADVSVDELDIELDGDGDDLIPALAEVLDIDESDVEDLALEIEDDLLADFDHTVEALESSFDEFDEGFSSIGEVFFRSSNRGLRVPSGSFTLPSGITAVAERSWGQVKDLLSTGASR